MPYELVIKIINEASDIGVLTIGFSGGEPFIRSDILDLIEYAIKKDLSVEIETNATLLTDSILRKLTQLGYIRLTISLDGAKEETHDYLRGSRVFNKVMNALKMLNTYNILVKINTTLYRNNINELPEILSIIQKHNIKLWQISLLAISGRAQKYKDLLSIDRVILKRYRDIICSVIKAAQSSGIKVFLSSMIKYYLNETITVAPCENFKNYLRIMPDGTVYPYPFAWYRIGNIGHTSLYHIIKELDIIRSSKKVCQVCMRRHICPNFSHNLLNS